VCVCVSVCPSVRLSVYLSVRLSVCPSVRLFVYLSVCLPGHQLDVSELAPLDEWFLLQSHVGHLSTSTPPENMWLETATFYPSILLYRSTFGSSTWNLQTNLPCVDLHLLVISCPGDWLPVHYSVAIGYPPELWHPPHGCRLVVRGLALAWDCPPLLRCTCHIYQTVPLWSCTMHDLVTGS